MRGAGWSAVGVAVVLALASPTRAAAQRASDPGVQANPWSLRLSAELGAGGRNIDLPRDGVVYQIRPGLFPAVGLGFELDHAASGAVTVGLLVRYQSSIGHGIVERHTDGSGLAMDVRSHRLELALAPTFDLDASRTWSLCASVGYAISNFRPEAHHLQTPAYSLDGPHLRAALQVAPWQRVVRLRVGPEVQWIVHVGQDLEDRGMAARGLGLGGEAAIELALGRRWILGASYRELRVWLDSVQAQRFEDVARFITARVSGKL
jgi:hypothetical protein